MIFLQLLNRSKQKKTAFFYFFFHLFLCTISRSFRQHTIGIIKKTTCAFSNCTIIFLYVCFSTVAVYGISQHATQRSGKPTLLFFFTFVTCFFFCFCLVLLCKFKIDWAIYGQFYAVAFFNFNHSIQTNEYDEVFHDYMYIDSEGMTFKFRFVDVTEQHKGKYYSFMQIFSLCYLIYNVIYNLQFFACENELHSYLN